VPGPWPSGPAIGALEVIIESPDHVASLTELTDAQLVWSFTAYRDRLVAWSQHPELAYGLVFKNARADGGASLEHVHSQLIATSHVPQEIWQEISRCAEHWRLQGRCIYCQLLERELQLERRMVTVGDEFVALCPFASRFPYEMWVFPRHHASHYASTSSAQLASCARVVSDLVCRLEAQLPTPAYNFWIHTAAFHDHSSAFHWHLELAPRVSRLAGFELGGGCSINPVSPEEAAQALRRAR
jgi:UDPglucose--hexose-1-phosphate uridylyltransferase